MIPTKLVIIWLVFIEGRQLYQLDAKDPMYPKKVYDAALEYNPPQERIKSSFSLGDRELGTSLLSQNNTTILSESWTKFYVNKSLKSYGGKRIRRNSFKSDNPNKDPGKLAKSKSFKILENSSSKSQMKAAETKESIRETQARIMTRYMDTSVEPCDDFYTYACGNWDKYHPIPKDATSTDSLTNLGHNVNIILRELLEEKPFETTYSLHKTDDHLKSIAKDRVNSSENPETQDDQEAENERLNQQLPREIPSIGQIRSRFKTATRIINSLPKSLCSNHTSGDHSTGDRCSHTQELTTPTSFIAKQSRAAVDSNDAERKAKMFYESCTNIAQRKQRGVKPLLDFIDGWGGWPVLKDNWSSKNFDWLNLTAHIRRYGNGILIHQSVEADFKNSDKNIIYFGQTELALPTRDYYLQEKNAKHLDAYQRFVSGVMHKLGASRVKSDKAAADLVRFETQLASITTEPSDNWFIDNKDRKPIALSDLRVLIPQIDWVRYLSVLQQRSVNESEQVIMRATDYMRDLVNLLNRTDPEIVANYLFWRFALRLLKNLDQRFDDIAQTFYREISGREENPAVWKVCLQQVNAGLGMVVSSMFVRKYFDESSKNNILNMTREVKQIFRENLKTIDWLDPETKHLAELKVDAMSLKVGYPDYILNSDRLNAEHLDLEIYPEQYFESTLNVLLHITRTLQNKLHEPVDKTNWEMLPVTVNAINDLEKNDITFPAGILQPPLYHRHFPRALNYGAIGTIIGHELTHGFDNAGWLFDRYGNKNDWWTNSSNKNFVERAQCIIEQYGNYTLEEVGIAVNGEKTQGENIADNGGIKLAFQAYKRWLHESPEAVLDNQLPGINMTGEQLFFLSFGQILCSAIRNETVSTTLKKDSHTPGRFRTIGAISNSEDFSKAFNCPLGSPMNPSHKCSVW